MATVQTRYRGLAEGGLIIGYVAATHLFWAVALMLSSDAMMATPVAGLSALGHRAAIITVLALSALGSACALGRQAWWVMWFLIPQQILLGLSFGTASQAVALQQYADGVLRPWAFIAADQAPTLLLAVVHFIAIIMFARDVHARG